jgi:hypothetical protein
LHTVRVSDTVTVSVTNTDAGQRRRTGEFGCDDDTRDIVAALEFVGR